MAELKVLRERVATDNIRAVASSKAAAIWKPQGSAVPLRTILRDLLACVDDGMLLSCWHEEGGDHLGRRYSGCPSIPPKATGPAAHFKRLLDMGANPGTVGRSLFAFPSYIRNLARAGLKDMFILDLANAHPAITLRRHPTMANIALYVNNREEVLASIPAPRALAKTLFLRLLYGGKAEAWCREHHVDPTTLPPIVHGFATDIARVHATDGGDPGTVQYIKNTEVERRAIDAIEQLLFSRGACIHAFEHDGACITLHGADIEELVQACSSACGFIVTVTRPPSFDECLDLLRTRSGMRDWSPTDDDWETPEALVKRARVESLTSHDLFAQVLLSEPRVSDAIPWPLRDLFRLCPVSRDLLWFNVKEGVWCEAQGGNGSQLLKQYITSMLQNRLRTYSIDDQKGDRFRPDELRWDLGNKSFRDGTEGCLRSHLVVDSSFILDPEESRRYLNFGTQCWDRDTESWVATEPSMLISRSTGWTYQPFNNQEMDRVDRALLAIRQEQDVRGLQEPSLISEEVQCELDMAALCMPELKFWYDLTRDWELAIHLLMHLARGTFGIPMAEALFVRSSGRSGKDTTANLLCALLGTYATSISADALCAIQSPDAPSPTFASLRARRFVAIREVADQKMQSSVFKRFVDPVSELSGRGLYESPVRFRPQYLAFFCSNAPLQMTTMDAAVRARTAVIDYASVFTQNPTEANHSQWRDMSKAIVDFRPGVFWLLQRVYHHLLRDRPMRNIAPVPEASLDAASLDCRDRQHELGDAFLACKITPAKGPSEATLASEVEEALSRELAIDRASAALWLQARGLERTKARCAGRGSRKGYFYKYCFTVAGVKALSPHYIKLA